MLKLRLALAFSLAGLLAACGGKVVVDLGTGDTGGSTGTAGGGQGGGFGGGSCFLPPDPDTLTFCGSMGTGGATATCQNTFCVVGTDDQWTALCEATTCQCLFNNDVVCTCALNGPGDFCLGTPTCCPLPKL